MVQTIDMLGGGVVRVRPDGNRNGSVYHRITEYYDEQLILYEYLH